MSYVDDRSKAVPFSIRYANSTPLCLKAQKQKISYAPINNNSFVHGQIATIQLASGAFGFINPAHSYLSANLECDYPAGNFGAQCGLPSVADQSHRYAYVNPEVGLLGAFSNISLTSESSGQLLENLGPHYNRWVAIMMSLCEGRPGRTDNQAGTSLVETACMGVCPFNLDTGEILIDDQAQGATNSKNLMPIWNPRAAAGRAQNAAQVGSVRLMAPLFGSALLSPAQKKYLCICLTGPIKLDLTIDSRVLITNTAGSGVSRANFRMTDLRMYCETITFDDLGIVQALSQLQASSGIWMHGVSFRGLQNNFVSPCTVIQLDKLSSITSCIGAVFRDTQDSNLNPFRRVGPLRAIQWRLGQSYYPVSPMNEWTQILIETLCSQGLFANLLHCSAISQHDYAGPANLVSSKFVFGVDLESFSREHSISGLNSLDFNGIELRCEWDSTAAVDPAYSISTFWHYDVIFHLGPDGRFTASY